MAIITTKSAMRALCGSWRAAGDSIALVQIAGAPHRGHAALFARARAEARRVVVALVPATPADTAMPTPDTPSDPVEHLREAGIDAVFRPEPGDWPLPQGQTVVDTPDLTRVLIGKLRPGHYRAMATQTARLFNIVQPDTACFGDKDYQLLCVIRQMARDLDSPVRITGTATVRDPDGLAVSRRNRLLTPADRAAARIVPDTLAQAQDMARTGITPSRLRAWVAARLQTEPRADPLLADIRDADTLASLPGPLTGPAVILLAVRFGKVLLIDQRVVTP